MKKMFDFSDKKRVARVILSHITMLLAVLVFTLFMLDRFNTAMEFMTSDLSRWVIGVFAFFALVSSVVNIVSLWVNPDKKKRRKE